MAPPAAELTAFILNQVSDPGRLSSPCFHVQAAGVAGVLALLLVQLAEKKEFTICFPHVVNEVRSLSRFDVPNFLHSLGPWGKFYPLSFVTFTGTTFSACLRLSAFLLCPLIVTGKNNAMAPSARQETPVRQTPPSLSAWLSLQPLPPTLPPSLSRPSCSSLLSLCVHSLPPPPISGRTADKALVRGFSL